jgi:hypothetical protein
MRRRAALAAVLGVSMARARAHEAPRPWPPKQATPALRPAAARRRRPALAPGRCAYPQGENASGRFDEPAPDSFRYTIASKQA